MDEEFLAFLKEQNELPEMDVADITRVIKRIHLLLSANDLESLDYLLKVFITPQSSPFLLITLLRTSFSYKELLVNYESSLEIAKQNLTMRGMDAESEFRGL